MPVEAAEGGGVVLTPTMKCPHHDPPILYTHEPTSLYYYSKADIQTHEPTSLYYYSKAEIRTHEPTSLYYYSKAEVQTHEPTSLYYYSKAEIQTTYYSSPINRIIKLTRAHCNCGILFLHYIYLAGGHYIVEVAEVWF